MIKILLVEDDKSIVSSLTVFLQSEECLVDSVDGQLGAIEKINTESFWFGPWGIAIQKL